MSKQIVKELFLADDDAVCVAHIDHAPECIISCFAVTSELFSLWGEPKADRSSASWHQKSLAPSHLLHRPEKLKTVKKFTKLGCVIFSDAKIDKEVDKWLAEMNSAFGNATTSRRMLKWKSAKQWSWPPSCMMKKPE